MTANHPRLLTAAVALLVAACSTGAGATPGASSQPVSLATLTATQLPAATPPPANSPAPTSSPAGGGPGQATPGPIDPCTLLTSKEASKLIGVQLGAGVSENLDPDRVCTFKNGLTEVKLILAPPGDLATAEAYWDAERAQVPADFDVKDLTVFDRSAFATGSNVGLSISGLFVIDGGNFFDLYCGFPACSENASVGTAELIAGRLP